MVLFYLAKLYDSPSIIKKTVVGKIKLMPKILPKILWNIIAIVERLLVSGRKIPVLQKWNLPLSSKGPDVTTWR